MSLLTNAPLVIIIESYVQHAYNNNNKKPVHLSEVILLLICRRCSACFDLKGEKEKKEKRKNTLEHTLTHTHQYVFCQKKKD
jgi:hypothetical protein